MKYWEDREKTEGKFITDGEKMIFRLESMPIWIPHVCCDCGLTHVFRYDLEENKDLIIQCFRDNESTQKTRDYKLGYWKTKKSGEAVDKYINILEEGME